MQRSERRRCPQAGTGPRKSHACNEIQHPRELMKSAKGILQRCWWQRLAMWSCCQPLAGQGAWSHTTKFNTHTRICEIRKVHHPALLMIICSDVILLSVTGEPICLVTLSHTCNDIQHSRELMKSANDKKNISALLMTMRSEINVLLVTGGSECLVTLSHTCNDIQY